MKAETLALVETAINDKNVRAVKDVVKISAKASPDNKDHEKEYTRYEALNARGMAALCGGKIEPSTSAPAEGKDERTDDQKANGACDYFNYGFDLDQRASVRASLMGELEGPEKAIAKLVKALVDGGLMTEPEAREYVVAQRTAKGLAV